MLDKLEKFSGYFDTKIEGFLKEKDEIPNLNDGVLYSISTKGKRIRPFLCYEVCKILNGDTEIVLPFAAAMEIMHSWILIHDDIEDGDTVRRNKPAVWIKYGIPHGINIGDYLQNKVYKIIINTRTSGIGDRIILKILNLVSQTLIYTTQGQALDMNLRIDNNPTIDKYITSVNLKAGYYLSCPIITGAIVAGAGDDLLNTINNYGQCIGPAFQIRDDLIDLTVGKGRNNIIGNDVREGKRTLLVIHALENSSPDEKIKLLNILNKKREQNTQEEIDWIIKLFRKHNSIEFAENYAKELLNQAEKEITELPEDLKIFLIEIAAFMIERKI
ncbi:MAG: hypothetical protein A2161_18450 [Candidatus Schekmanbacteria bacterium RBG_13_48_7]|uniref:Polyprenyl synthetase n=1 Tax=Candidatus Schekmanbacteria bacterium RBG_13_48_7 TaxID=1817878 RepID=A0A1F7RNM6_9BACT|nr:MAG: hypothetical protein A2161_18450 [Candidatus Schekmanbacteria bacterium RBG_13_48_7]